MSKIGKQPIIIPPEVEVKINEGLITVKGPKGTLEKALGRNVNIEIKDGKAEVSVTNERLDAAMWGLFRALLQNMVLGVVTPFEKVLEFQGVGYKANVKGDNLELSLGFSHPIVYQGKTGISFVVEKNAIKVTGCDKELVGQVAAEIRSFRKPEPYKGSGIRYRGEIIKKKAGKKAVASGG